MYSSILPIQATPEVALLPGSNSRHETLVNDTAKPECMMITSASVRWTAIAKVSAGEVSTSTFHY